MSPYTRSTQNPLFFPTHIPSGQPATPLALGFDCATPSDVQDQLEAVLAFWEEAGVVVQLDVAKTDDGFTYRFSCDGEHLAVSVA